MINKKDLNFKEYTAVISAFNKEDWYNKLEDNGKFIFELLVKYHTYFSKQDRLYKKISRCIKVSLLFFSMCSTIILGMKNIIEIDTQVLIGLFISALISFITAISSYFNFEEYWMRNISVHLKLNILRDCFIFDAKSGDLNIDKIREYREKIEEIQKNNVKYWEKALNRM